MSKNKKTPNKLKRRCAECGSSFEVYPSHAKNGDGKYCSTYCYHRSRIVSIEDNGLKLCTKCHQMLPIDAFFLTHNQGSKRKPMCKYCRANYQKIHGQTESGKKVILEGRKKYESSKRGKTTRRRYEQSENRKADRRQRARAYYHTEEGRTLIRQRVADYYNTEHGKEVNRRAGLKYSRSEYGKARKKQYDASPKGKAVWRRYFESPKGRAAVGRMRNKRRARLSIECTLTSEEWQEILSDYERACAYCGRTDQVLQIDHVIPISKNGHHTKKNVVPACGRCNLAKRDKLDWIPRKPNHASLPIEGPEK